MNPEMDRVEYRVDLDKRPGAYFVVADDEGIYVPRVWRKRNQRYVLEVQRAADHPVERYLQHQDLDAAALGSQSPIHFRTYQAVSHGHAARLALRAYAEEQAFERLQDDSFVLELPFGDSPN
ncbi:hypothetical protein [Streptomyces sp. NPDC020983]|uniref:hypothetical protein n=1 Tax=Streptomyces sp. NPDC020983 TaxID=3365106 RepID=UPI0037B895E0